MPNDRERVRAVRIEIDYETVATVTVFENSKQAEGAFELLREVGISRPLIHTRDLAPGRYQCRDPSLDEVTAGVLSGAALGMLAGVTVGLAFAAASGRRDPELFVSLAAIVIACTVVGSLVGSAIRARYDDDVAASIDLTHTNSAVLVLVETHSLPATRRARQALTETAALATLDPSTCAAVTSMPLTALTANDELDLQSRSNRALAA
jgi:hypothetical protein